MDNESFESLGTVPSRDRRIELSGYESTDNFGLSQYTLRERFAQADRTTRGSGSQSDNPISKTTKKTGSNFGKVQQVRTKSVESTSPS